MIGDLHCLADAEPQDRERDQRERRHRALDLDEAINRCLANARQARDECQKQPDSDADGKPHIGALGRRHEMGPERAIEKKLPAGCERRGRRREMPR